MSVSERVAFLRGLMEGLELPEDDKTTKVLNAIVDTLDDIACELQDANDITDELSEYIEEVDEALGDLEEFVYEDDCDCDCDCCDDEDSCVEVTCPACNEDVCIDIDAIDENGQVECPACGELLEFDIEDCCDCEDCE